MTRHPYRLTGPIGAKATLGLIVLQTDETVENDFRRLFADPEVALHVTRIPSGAEVTAETLAAMEAELPAAARLLPASAAFDAIGYCCTSGATVIGPSRVHDLVASAARTRSTTDPLTAVTGALAALGARRVAVLSPYIEPVADRIAAALASRGFTVPAALTFGEEAEAKVARIDPASVREAALYLGRSTEADALFLSCTNLRTLDVLAEIETALGLPVVSSNQALAWDMSRLSGAPVAGPGRLFGA